MHTPGSGSELALLRSRAYGPDADISGDAEALRRLAQLESAIKAPHPDAASASVDLASASAETASGSTPARSRWWLVSLIAAVAVVAALVGAGGLAVIQVMVAPRPDAVLSTADVDPRTDAALDEQWLGYFSMNRADLRGFDEYDGFRSWAGTSDDGLQCLFVLGAEGGLAAYSCTTSGVMPVADAEVADDSGVTAPPRRIIRFELHGDAVHVFDRSVPGAVEGL